MQGQQAGELRSGFGGASAHRDTHQLSVAQLLHARHALVQFGGLTRPHVGVDHLDNFGRFAGGDVATGRRFRDGCHEISSVPRAC